MEQHTTPKPPTRCEPSERGEAERHRVDDRDRKIRLLNEALERAIIELAALDEAA